MEVRSFREFLEAISTAKNGFAGPPWYRGVTLGLTYGLLPRLFRHPSITDVGRLLEIESETLDWFRMRSVPYLPVAPPNDWWLLFLMQHHGIPTRLLDWTENPLTGLYFATSSPSVKTGEPAAVWVLDATTWNREALRHMSYRGGPVMADSQVLSAHTPNRVTGLRPVTMQASHNSARIVAQRGVFAVFGTEASPMENQVAALGGTGLVKIEIPRDAVQAVRQELLEVGITESVVYPDLDGLAAEGRRLWAFEP